VVISTTGAADVIIVLEGPDLAGKSTIARWIMDMGPNRELLRAGQPSPSVSILEQYLRPIQDWCYEPMIIRPEMLVLDRWHVGETIYGPLLRDRSRLTPQQMDYIDMVLQTFGGAFLYVTQSVAELERRWDERSDDLIKREWLAEIHRIYEATMATRPHWVPISSIWSDKPIIERYVARSPSPMAGLYIGPRHPQVLLLGDERNDTGYVFPFVPARPTSGHWLMSAMRDAEVNHMRVGIMNACERTPTELATQWITLGCPKVITLGRNAMRAWNVAAAKRRQFLDATHYLNHPQYERRFHHSAKLRYGQVIKDVMELG
jgi:hypothetical protein